MAIPFVKCGRCGHLRRIGDVFRGDKCEFCPKKRRKKPSKLAVAGALLARENAILRSNMELDRQVLRLLARLQVREDHDSGNEVLVAIRDGAILVRRARQRVKAWSAKPVPVDDRDKILLGLAKAWKGLDKVDAGCDCRDCKNDRRAFRKAVTTLAAQAYKLARKARSI